MKAFILIAVLFCQVIEASAIEQLNTVELAKLYAAADEALDGGDRSAVDSIATLILDLGEAYRDKYALNYGYFLKCSSLMRSNPEKGIEFGEKALLYFQEENDLEKIKLIKNSLAASYSVKGDHRKAILLFQEAIDLSKVQEGTKENKKFLSRTTYNLSNCYFRKGILSSAAEYLTEAHALAIELKDSSLLAAILHQYGRLEYERKDFAKALEFYKSSYPIYKSVSPTRINYPLMSIGMSFHDLNQPDSALYYYQRAIAHDRKIKNIPNLCSALGNCAELYLETGRLKEALKYAEELSLLSEKYDLKQHKIHSAYVLIKVLVELEDYKKADQILKKGSLFIDEDVEFSSAYQFYNVASDLEEKVGHYKNALLYNKLSKQYSDSLINQESLAVIDELQMKFESEQKDKQIQRLETESKISALAYKQKLTMFGAFSFGLLMLSLLLYLIINKRRLQLVRQKENIERRLLRSQMNPHFIFNAISSIQNYLYDKSDLKVALNYMSKFAELMRQILENSREEYVPLSEEIKSLENYLELQQLRYSNSFGYKILVDDDLDISQIMVPPLIAQPFVENAIEHGKIYRIENGLVKISFTNKKDKIELIIEDNGVGTKSLKIAPKKIEHKKKSLATIMTNERLELLSKINRSKFEMAISSLREGGTLVSIQLPKILAA